MNCPLFLKFFSIATLASAWMQVHAADDIVINDFTDSDYGMWQVTGTAFGDGPASGSRLDSFTIKNAQDFAVATSETGHTDAKMGTLTSPSFKVERPYISFLISGGGNQHNTCMNLLLDDGTVVKSATGENSEVMKSASWDVSAFMGKEVQIQIVDTATNEWGHINVAHIIQTDHPDQPPVTPLPLYQEALRPQFHFTARQWTIYKLNPGPTEEGWMNDVNGPIYYDGEYHLFAQRWWKCWIHAVSPDLVHWTELPPAFWEQTGDSGTQSGTCVIDYKNTSGLSQDPSTPPMVAFWPTIAPSQNITYSLDHGRTWAFYDRNPILNHGTRDPKVFWYEPTQMWVMFLYDDPNLYRIFTSSNLLRWKDTGNSIPNSYECPDFFQLPVDGDKNNMKWVLVRGNGRYSIGDFDGFRFSEETPQMDSDSGPNFYATQTWNNMETGDGRRVQIAWMRSDRCYPNMPFNQQMTFPREFTLHTTPAGLRLFREPIKEIAKLHGHEDDLPKQDLTDGAELKIRDAGQSFHIQAEVNIPEGTTVTFHLCGIDLNLTHAGMQCAAKADVSGGLTYVEILVDRTSVEAFANHGEASLSQCFVPSGEGVSLTCHGGPATLQSLKTFDVLSAWKNPIVLGSKP
jgi:fructan beta-fructosidase